MTGNKHSSPQPTNIRRSYDARQKKMYFTRNTPQSCCVCSILMFRQLITVALGETDESPDFKSEHCGRLLQYTADCLATLLLLCVTYVALIPPPRIQSLLSNAKGIELLYSGDNHLYTPEVHPLFNIGQTLLFPILENMKSFLFTFLVGCYVICPRKFIPPLID